MQQHTYSSEKKRERRKRGWGGEEDRARESVCVREREKESGRDGRTGRERMLALTRAVQEGGAQSKFRVCAKYHLLCAGREGRYVCECVCL